MTFLHNAIKIMYTEVGYLADIPYHLVSDAEMFNAFLKDDGFFNNMYPCPSDDLQTEYETLRSAIVSRIDAFLKDGTKLPDWVYSYMVGRPVTYGSDEADIAYLYELTGIKPPQTLAEFSAELAEECYRISVEWMKKLPSRYADRPPTMFGETHVTKSLRLKQADILIDTEGV